MERWYLLITEKFLFWTFRKWKTRSFCKPKSWWKDDIYWLLKSSCFELFGGGKYGLFLSQKVGGKMIFTDYWKILVWNFSNVGNTAFFWAKKLIKRWYLLITCFELFGDRNYGLFWAKKLIQRWYLLGLFELSMIFQGLGNIIFRAV